MTYRLYQFGTTVLPDYNEEADIGLGVSAKSAQEIPSGGAIDLYGGERILPGATKLTKGCTLHATSEASLLSQYMALRALTGTRDQLYRMRIADEALEWVWARLDVLTATRRYGQKSRLFQDIKLNFTVFSPAWYGETENSVDEFAPRVSTDDIPTCHAESKYTGLTVAQDGNVDQPDVKITISAAENITLVTVTNGTTGHTWYFDGTITAGQDLVVDCGAMSVLNNGADAYVDFTPTWAREEWFILQPGNNTITVAANGDCTIEIEYYDAYA